MLTGYPLSCTLGRSVLGIGSGVARFLITAEYATYRYMKFIYRIFRRIRRPLKCNNPPLKIGVVSCKEYKSHIIIST